MRHDELAELARAARERHGRVTGASLRAEALDTNLAAEMAAEQAGVLVRLGRRLDAALTLLADLQSEASSCPPERRRRLVEAHDRARDELLEARWELKVVREAIGMRGTHADLDLFWPVPPKLSRPA